MLRSLFKKDKKGMSLGDSPTMIMTLVVIAIVGAIGLSVVVGVQGTFTADSAADNATDKVVDGITNFFDLIPVLGTVLIAVVLLAAVGALAYFGYMRNR